MTAVGATASFIAGPMRLSRPGGGRAPESHPPQRGVIKTSSAFQAGAFSARATGRNGSGSLKVAEGFQLSTDFLVDRLQLGRDPQGPVLK